MAARSRARRRALEVLFEAEARSVPPLDVLAERMARAETPLNDYVATLVEGVVAHQDRIDALLETYAEGWELARMPAVDRNVLRIGVWELLWGDVPEEVALDEAVGLVQEMSTEGSPRFVNGLLGRLKDLKPSLAP